MDIMYAVILGAVQGITEFLPISSTAHLILTSQLLHAPVDQFGLPFDVALHIGTAFAVLVYFWQTWWRLIINSFRPGTASAQSIDRKILLALLVGTIPAAMFGLLFEDMVATAFRSPLVIAFALVFGSAIFYIAEKVGTRRKSIEQMSLANSFLIGCSQAIALIPGISRSGITISSGLLQNYDRETAARFAFLLSTPIIFGAGLKEFLNIVILDPIPINWTLFAVGTSTSLITGYLTIVYFMRFMRTNSLMVFIWYRIALAAVIFVLLFMGILSL